MLDSCSVAQRPSRRFLFAVARHGNVAPLLRFLTWASYCEACALAAKRSDYVCRIDDQAAELPSGFSTGLRGHSARGLERSVQPAEEPADSDADRHGRIGPVLDNLPHCRFK